MALFFMLEDFFEIADFWPLPNFQSDNKWKIFVFEILHFYGVEDGMGSDDHIVACFVA